MIFLHVVEVTPRLHGSFYPQWEMSGHHSRWGDCGPGLPRCCLQIAIVFAGCTVCEIVSLWPCVCACGCSHPFLLIGWRPRSVDRFRLLQSTYLLLRADPRRCTNRYPFMHVDANSLILSGYFTFDQTANERDIKDRLGGFFFSFFSST